MSRKYLVTGGAGFVGATLVRQLLDQGESVTVLDRGEAASAGDVARNFSDISKARRVLGWEPQVSLREGIAQALDWFRGRRRD